MRQLSLKQRIERRFESLKRTRASWDPQWQNIGQLMSSRLGRFSAEETNRGEEKHTDILNSTPLSAYRALAQGLVSGMTSRSRPWFKLTLSDDSQADSPVVKEWLDEVTQRMRRIFQNSNTYRALHSMYEELALFGTSACFVTRDEEKVIYHHPLTIGEYWVSANHKGEIDTLYRRIQKTAYELVEEFGIDNVSPSVKVAYETDAKDTPCMVIHAVEPNPSRDKSKKDAKNMAWRSVYFEEGGESDKLLRVSGFKRFPVLCARWAVTGNDVYGCSPGMDALGDVRMLYALEKSKYKGISQIMTPALVVTGAGKELDIRPSAVNVLDAMAGSVVCTPLAVGPINIQPILNEIAIVGRRIEELFYKDLFLMIANGENTQMTATEVAERREEKMMMLGPVVERLQNELLNPLIDIAFDHMAQGDLLPPVPSELEGQDYKVELVGMMAQAQQAVEANALIRFLNAITTTAQAKPEILDKIDEDALTDEMAKSYGISQSIVRPTEEANKLRAQRAQMQQAMQQAAMQNQAADTAQKLAAAKTDEDSLLTEDMGALAGY